MDLDIVIVNHRTPQLMRECVESLETYLYDANIIPVDNSEPKPGVGPPLYGGWIVPNLGYGHACNYGARKGDADFILFLNGDTRATEKHHTKWIEELFRLNPDIGIIGPKQVHPDGWIASAGCRFNLTNGVGYEITGWHTPDTGQYNEPVVDCAYVAGSVMYMRRSLWEDIGGLLEDPGHFSQYYEDAYAAYAGRHFGSRTVYTGLSTWLHWWDASPKPQHEQLVGRDWVAPAHALFVRRLKEIGYSGDIPPLV